MSECDAVEARVENESLGAACQKRVEDDDERECTCHVDARAGDLLYTGVSRESVGHQPGARPSKPGQTARSRVCCMHTAA
jgi:hypothetical protein